MKWYFVCICFDFEWKTKFLARKIALWLSLCRMLISCFLPNSSKKPCSQIISFPASVAAIYSASVVDKLTIFCRFEAPDIAVPPRVKTNPVVLFLLSISPAKNQHLHNPAVSNLHMWSKDMYLMNPSDISESTWLPLNAAFLAYSWICSQLPLHVQCLALYTP